MDRRRAGSLSPANNLRGVGAAGESFGSEQSPGVNTVRRDAKTEPKGKPKIEFLDSALLHSA